MDRRITHGNCVRPLPPDIAITGRGGEVLQGAVRIADPEIAAARHRIEIGAVIAKDRTDCGKVSRYRHLGDKKDRIGGGRVTAVRTCNKHGGQQHKQTEGDGGQGPTSQANAHKMTFFISNCSDSQAGDCRV